MSSNSSRNRSLKIALLGTRGIPANYGGFETFAEQLSTRLVDRGHRVTVYGRSHFVHPDLHTFRGVDLQVLPAFRSKYLETVTHTSLSVLHALFCPYDLLLVCNAANAFLCWIPGLRGQKVVLNVDGIEHMRRKWNRVGKAYYRLGEFLSTIIPDCTVTDAHSVERYYLDEYGFRSKFIPYGAPNETVASSDELKRLGLSRRRYLLYVSRLEPENNARLVIKAYLCSGVEYPLVVIGDAPYNRGYIRELRRLAEGKNVLLPGAIYGKGYRELLAHCLCYVQATEVGGTHPALVEAMGAGALVLVNDTPENREVVHDCGFFYLFNQLESLSRLMQEISLRFREYEDHRKKAQLRVQQCYDWENIVTQYEELFYGLTASSVEIV